MKKVRGFILFLVCSGVVVGAQAGGLIYPPAYILPSPGTVQDMSLASFPATVAVTVGSGDTVSCYMSLTPGAGQHVASSRWFPLTSLTAITASDSITLPSRVAAVECIQTAGTGTDYLEMATGQ